MADPAPQSYDNHAQFNTLYHFILFPLFTLYFLWTVYLLVRHPTLASAIHVAVAFGFLSMLWVMRLFPLTVQDRVIRLEETLRFQRLLPPDLAGRIGELRRGQFIALRFASDDEVPDLVRQVLAGELTKGDDIKKAIKTWRPDYLRC